MNGNTSSHVQLEKACKEYGIKPLYGCELYTAPTDPEGNGAPIKTRKKFHQTVIAQNEEGYRNLNRLVSASWRDHFFQWPTTSARLLQEFSEGLVVLSGCSDSLLSCALLGGKELGEKRLVFSKADFRRAVQIVERYQDIFGENYFLEVQRFPGLERSCVLNPAFAEISKITGVKLAATADVHYPMPEDNEMQRILHAAHRGGTVESVDAAWEYDILLTYPLSDQEIIDDLIGTGLSRKDAIRAVKTTAEIAESATVLLPRNEPIRFPYPGSDLEGMDRTWSWETEPEDNKGFVREYSSIEEYIWQKLRDGWEFRSKTNDEMLRSEERTQEYVSRLQYEMEQVSAKGFLHYFAMLSDAVAWAKDHKIPVGPARGSAAASLTCYLLRITEVDPMQFPNMLFARFIDPNRLDLPDVDLDFSDTRRDEVRMYLISVYGADRVGNIGNFTRYKGKNSLDDIARVYLIPKYEAETIKKLIVERSGGDARQSESLADTFAMFPKAREVLERHPELRLATRLEGNYRGLGVHAAGIVISNAPITETCAVYTRPKANSAEQVTVVAYDKKDTEYLGMLKADFLGLSTMGMIEIALNIIGMDLEDLYRVPITEPRVLRAFKENDLTGIFQFEGRATAIVNHDVSPDNFGHLADINALSRPGPLFSGMTAQYINVKHGREEPEKLHPVVDRLTGWTYGQIVYQEQVLSIVKDLAGFPMTRVGDIRRIISQKLGNMVMAEAAKEFEKGCFDTHGIKPELAKKIWNFIATSSTYSFCVTGGTVLERGGAGRHDASPEITVEQLWLNANDRSPKGKPLSDKIRSGRLMLKSMSDDGRIRLDRMKKIVRIEEYSCSTVTTTTGRSITVSNDHPLLTSEGYKTPLELEPGMKVVVDLGKEAREAEKQAARRSGVGHGWAKGLTWVDGKRMDIDGRTRLLEAAKMAVRERSNDKCEHCGKTDSGEKHCLEFAHVMQLNDHEGRYESYHTPDNILHLCNSCHKKFDWRMQRSRKVRWSYGNPTGYETIASIEDAGKHPVYDIEMEGDQHNYIGNGFVNHNNQSHSVSYSLLAFWAMYLKIYHPTAFYAAQLTKVGDGKDDLYDRGKLMQDAIRHSISILPPDLNKSEAGWTADLDAKAVIAGMVQVHGIGPKTSENILSWRSSMKALGKKELKWADLTAVKGIGPKTIEKIVEFAESEDPFGIHAVENKIRPIRKMLTDGTDGLEFLPTPTHHSTEMPQHGQHTVIWLGIPRDKNYKDYVEATRTRTGKEVEEIIANMKDPDLVKSCVVRSYDEGDEDVYLRFNRWQFPKFEEALEALRLNEDLILVKGSKREDFGISIHVTEMWIIQGD